MNTKRTMLVVAHVGRPASGLSQVREHTDPEQESHGQVDYQNRRGGHDSHEGI